VKIEKKKYLGFLFFPFLGGRTLEVYCDFITQMQKNIQCSQILL
jgi:hypothetical protein